MGCDGWIVCLAESEACDAKAKAGREQHLIDCEGDPGTNLAPSRVIWAAILAHFKHVLDIQNLMKF